MIVGLATVMPVSNSGPHFTSPKPISTRPHASVMPRERRTKRRGRRFAAQFCKIEHARSGEGIQ